MLKENIRLALASLKANRLRSLLTMLGIIIGIASVITIVTVGDSLAAQVNQEMSSAGGRNLTIGLQAKATEASETDSGEAIYAAAYEEPAGEDLISPQMIAEYEKKFSEQIEGVSFYENTGSTELTNGSRKASVSLYGINAGFQKTENLKLLAGRWLRPSDMAARRHVVLVSDKFLKAYFGTGRKPEKALDTRLSLLIGGNTVNVYVAGVFQEPANGMYSYDDGSSRVLLPVSLVKEMAGRPAGYSQIVISPKADIDTKTFTQATAAYFQSCYAGNPRYEAQVYSNESFLKSVNEIMAKLKLGIGAIAAISLFVGGIGVMNIMMVSVSERTREIGIRMALGARRRNILMQFVIEAMVICMFGGMIGVILGVGAGSAAARFLGAPVTPSLTAIVTAVAFAMGIGLFFGWYPARRASDLDPIEALRYE